jgi:hypothetical protein
MIGVGFIVSTWVGYGSSKVPVTSSFSWRFPLAFQCVPCVILICGMMFFPESPRYLCEHDRADEALVVLKKLHADGTNDEWIRPGMAGHVQSSRMADATHACHAHTIFRPDDGVSHVFEVSAVVFR